MVPQTYLDSDGKMAPGDTRKYGHVAITVDDLIAEGESWKVRAPRFIITSTLEVVDAFVHSERPVERAYVRLQDDFASPWTITMDAHGQRPQGKTRRTHFYSAFIAPEPTKTGRDVGSRPAEWWSFSTPCGSVGLV